MRLVLLLLGVTIGFALASAVGRTGRGREVLTTVNGSASEFARTVADSYRARQAELGSGG